MAKSLLERFEALYMPEPNSGCWLWIGYVNFGGYGYTSKPGHRHLAAHRVAYELFVGPIPEGLDLDHKCRVRCCVNPAHLEPVTRSENVKRGLMPDLSKARAAAVTHCPQGHEYTADNTLSYIDRKGYRRRECRECSHRKKRRYYKNAKLAAGSSYEPRIFSYAARTHCKHGHELTAENTAFSTHLGKMRRHCRACDRAKSLKYRKNKKC